MIIKTITLSANAIATLKAVQAAVEFQAQVEASGISKNAFISNASQLVKKGLVVKTDGDYVLTTIGCEYLFGAPEVVETYKVEVAKTPVVEVVEVTDEALVEVTEVAEAPKVEAEIVNLINYQEELTNLEGLAFRKSEETNSCTYLRYTPKKSLGIHAFEIRMKKDIFRVYSHGEVQAELHAYLKNEIGCTIKEGNHWYYDMAITNENIQGVIAKIKEITAAQTEATPDDAE